MRIRSRSNLLRVFLAAVVASQAVLPCLHAAADHGSWAQAGALEGVVVSVDSHAGHMDCRICEMVRSGNGMGIDQQAAAVSMPLYAGRDVSTALTFASVAGFTSASTRGPPGMA